MPDRDKYTNMLKCSIEEFFNTKKERVSILVDAYDELLSTKDEKLENAAVERAAVRSCLSSLTIPDHVKILIRTRPQYCKELQATFSKSKVVNIQGDDKDMKTYLESRLDPLSLGGALKKKIQNMLLEANKEEKW